MLEVDLEVLATAYRRAKADLFRRDDSRSIELVRYEQDLRERLEVLRSLLASEDTDWVSEPWFTGGFSLGPTSARVQGTADRHSLRSANPAKVWEVALSTDGVSPEAEFRVFSHCSIDMHVLSTLWMMGVGARLERSLGPHCYGSRLKREQSGSPNHRTIHSFQAYIRRYKQWRNNALSAINSALADGEDLVLLSADATSFYHQLDPSFLVDDRFLDGVTRVECTEEEEALNHLFVRALLGWSFNVGASTGWGSLGIPVGLPASAVVANLSLKELDDLALGLEPLYYGRYVDDILLVLKDDGEFVHARDVWERIAQGSGQSLRWVDGVKAHPDIEGALFRPPYLQDSRVIFGNKKNRILALDSVHGPELIDMIRRNIDATTSAWHAIPALPTQADEVASHLVMALRDDGTSALSLSQLDRVAYRKSSFVLLLHACEWYERRLDPSSWAEVRRAFLRIFVDHAIADPTTFFDLASYLPRVMRLAVACRDWEGMTSLVEGLAATFSAVAGTGRADECTLRIKHFAEADADRELVAGIWGAKLQREVLESFASSLSDPIEQDLLDQMLEPIWLIGDSDDGRPTVVDLVQQNQQLFVRDLAYLPYSAIFAIPELDSDRHLPSGEPAPSLVAVHDVPLDEELTAGLNLVKARLDHRPMVRAYAADLSGSMVSGISFPTRPLREFDLYLLVQGVDTDYVPWHNADEMQEMVRALVGYSVDHYPVSSDGDTLYWPGPSVQDEIDIGLTMVETGLDCCMAALGGRPNLSIQRWSGLSEIVNLAIQRRPQPRYLVFHELSIPTRWFADVAVKCGRAGINLVAGVEYQRGHGTVVHNEVWAALQVGSVSFYRHYAYRQSKQKPAVEERKMLACVGLELVPAVEYKSPPILRHGEFQMAILICSEMTNIEYRASLRGRVDALLVPAWNKDLHTFGALVDSAALDLHGFVVQVNVRSLGDTRIRAPRYVPHERDVVRLRGGEHDYLVVGQIDVAALREHQVTGDKKYGFKPTPDGFVQDPARHPPDI